MRSPGAWIKKYPLLIKTKLLINEIKKIAKLEKNEKKISNPAPNKPTEKKESFLKSLTKATLAIAAISSIIVYNHNLYKNKNIKQSLKRILDKITNNKGGKKIIDKNKTEIDQPKTSVTERGNIKTKKTSSTSHNSILNKITADDLHQYIPEHFNIFNALDKKGLAKKFNLNYKKMVVNIPQERLSKINKYFLDGDKRHLEDEDFHGLPQNLIDAIYEIY